MPQLLFQSSMTTFMSAFQLAFSGHTSAVHATVRAALEAALYGYVISRGEDHFGRWKNPPQDSKKKVRASEAFRFLKEEGIDEHVQLKANYEALIALGAHPNKPSISLHTRLTTRDDVDESEFIAIYGPSKQSAVYIANAIGTAALTMVVAGATLTDCRARLFEEGRTLYKRLLDYLESNAAPPRPASNGTPTRS
ncbi:hypothetical protein WHX56_14125 [Achromobacter veterisilvae]|uniref:Uncharacterized protein n=1 Tax=Achromobacter veterisilvae TaxID=2069367 RepID=A0ABZ2SB63_9BURK